jgi:segregation and condensation protein A
LEIRREEVTVAEMIEHVKQVLVANPRPVRLDDLIAGYVSRQALIALFLALLEMVRLRAILLRQRELFAPITVHPNKRFEEIMSAVRADVLEAGLEESFG